MRTSYRVAQKSPARKAPQRDIKTRGKGAPIRRELALAMVDALGDILRYEQDMKARRSA